MSTTAKSCPTTGTDMPNAKPNQPLPFSSLMPAPAGPADFPCQIVASLVSYLPYTSAAALSPVPRPSSLRRKATKTAQLLCNLSHLESTLLQVFILKNLISFRINTYKKQGEGWEGPQVVNFSLDQPEPTERTRHAF